MPETSENQQYVKNGQYMSNLYSFKHRDVLIIKYPELSGG